MIKVRYKNILCLDLFMGFFLFYLEFYCNKLLLIIFMIKIKKKIIGFFLF